MRALLLGRFQPPHRGHLYAIRRAARRFDDVLVVVGSAQHSHEPRNPFTIGERFDMLSAAFDEAHLVNVHLFAVPDLHRHAAWVAFVEALMPHFDVVVTNNPLTIRLFQEARYLVEPAPLWRPAECSGSGVRALWARGRSADALLPPAVQAVARRIAGPDRVRALLRDPPRHAAP